MQVRSGFQASLVPKGRHAIPGAPPADQEIHGEKRPDTVISRSRIKCSAAYRLSFVAHYRLVTIHPWADGNGRMSRLVMNMLQWEFGLIPVKVLKEQKAEYIQALNDTRDQQDESIFPDVMTRLHNANLQSEIDAYVASQEAETPQGVLHGVADDLTDRQRVILEILNNVAVNVAVNTKYLSEKLGVNRKTIQRDVVALQEKRLIQWVGSDKTGHWEIKNPTSR